MKIDILVYPGVDELDCIAPMEVLRTAAHFGADFQVRMVSIYPELKVTASHKLVFEADSQFEPGMQDMIIVPGGSWLSKAPQGAFAEYEKGHILTQLKLAKQNNESLIVASVCTGSMLLAHAGLIGTKRCTTHHSCFGEIEKLKNNVVKDRVVDDGTLITAGGVTSGIDLAFHLVTRFASKDIALRVEDLMEYEPWVPKVE
jgi:transcriptional regulator GlxA family with amidase domain